MILQTLENNSIVVIGNLINEHETVAAFRQFRVDEIVKNAGLMWRITTVDTYVDSNTHLCHNWYTLVAVEDESIRGIVDEITLLRDNPRSTPDNIFDAIADTLPRPHFVAGSWHNGKVLTRYLKNMT